MADNYTEENYPENSPQLWLLCKISINKRKMWKNCNNLLLPPVASTAKSDRIKHTEKKKTRIYYPKKYKEKLWWILVGYSLVVTIYLLNKDAMEPLLLKILSFHLLRNNPC